MRRTQRPRPRGVKGLSTHTQPRPRPFGRGALAIRQTPPPNEKMRRCPPRNPKGSWRWTLGGGDTTKLLGGRHHPHNLILALEQVDVVLAVDEIELVVVALDEIDLVARSLDDEDKLAQPGTR